MCSQESQSEFLVTWVQTKPNPLTCMTHFTQKHQGISINSQHISIFKYQKKYYFTPSSALDSLCSQKKEDKKLLLKDSGHSS